MSSQYQGFNWNGATGINGTLSLSNSFGVTQNSRVGIGTTTPSGSLSVTPPQYSIGTASQSGNTITGVGTVFTTDMVGSQFVFANGTSAGTITGFTSPTILTVSTLQTVAVQAYYISYTGLQVSSTNGNVGIGTTVPTNILSLGNASAQKIWIENTATDVSGRALTVAAGGTVAGTSVNNVSGGQLILQSGSGTGTGDSSIAFQTATTLATGTTLQTMSTKMTILGNGRVGIGTTNPANALHVNVSDTNTNSVVDVLRLDHTLSSGTSAAGIGTGIKFASPDASGAAQGSASIYGILTSTTTAAELGALAFLTKRSTGALTEAVRIDSSGNVGIGTTAPTNILSLGNASAQKIWIENTATDVSGRALTVAAGGTVAGTSVNNVSGGQLILQSGSGTGTGDSSIAFQTATTLATGTTLQTMSTKMTILGNGNVGIGTTAPNGALSVVSTNVSGLTTSSAINLVANSLTSGTGVYASSSTLTTGKLLDLQVSGTAAAASQTALNILTAGANATAAITTYGAQISNTHTNATSGTNVALYLNASGATTANYGLIVNAGNVGIGIAAPLAVLNVKDARNANSSSLATSATGATVFIQPKSGSGYVIAFGSGPSDYPYMQFVTTDGLTASSMLLNPYGGNVGIGTTAPGQPLDVNGVIRSRNLVQFSDGATVYGYMGKAGFWEGNADTNICIAAEGAANGLKFYTGGSAVAAKMSITSAGNVGIGTTTTAVNEKLRVGGDVGSNSPSVAFTSANSNVSVPSGVATTIYTFPTQARIVFYEVFVRLDTGGSPAQYAGMTTLAVGGGTIKQMSVVNGSLLVLTLSAFPGLDLQVTQSSGGTQNVMTSVRQTFASSGF